ncbi:MAG: hypothetical protein SGCHY_000881 [Lobulomycetales sp.]
MASLTNELLCSESGYASGFLLGHESILESRRLTDEAADLVEQRHTACISAFLPSPYTLSRRENWPSELATPADVLGIYFVRRRSVHAPLLREFHAAFSSPSLSRTGGLGVAPVRLLAVFTMNEEGEGVDIATCVKYTLYDRLRNSVPGIR